MSATAGSFGTTVTPSGIARACLPLASCRRATRTRRRPQVRLEDVAPEETEIIDLERKIDEARRNGTPCDEFVRKRSAAYDSWLSRLGREIEQTTSESRLDYLKGQLERVRIQYGR
jgi:hypothetical protein